MERKEGRKEEGGEKGRKKEEKEKEQFIWMFVSLSSEARTSNLAGEFQYIC